MNEVQVICTVMSADKDQDPDVIAMIGAAAALAVSGIPFSGPRCRSGGLRRWSVSAESWL